MKLEIFVKKTFEIDVELSEILDSIHLMPLAQRINIIGSLINGIDDENGIEELPKEQKGIIFNWLNGQLPKYKP